MWLGIQTSAVHVLEACAKDDSETRDRFLDHIVRECDRLARIARALLVLARATSGEEAARRELVKLLPLLEDAIDGAGGSDGVELRCPDSVTVFVDRAILRRRELDRTEVGDGGRRQVGGLELDLARRVATVDGRPIQLTESELRLLALMMEKPGRVFSRRELMQHLWESTYVGDQRAADVHIAHLRGKIESDPQSPVAAAHRSRRRLQACGACERALTDAVWNAHVGVRSVCWAMSSLDTQVSSSRIDGSD
jgi:hypothetical protein